MWFESCFGIIEYLGFVMGRYDLQAYLKLKTIWMWDLQLK